MGKVTRTELAKMKKRLIKLRESAIFNQREKITKKACKELKKTLYGEIEYAISSAAEKYLEREIDEEEL